MWAHLTVRPEISMCCRGGKSKRRGGRAMPDRQRSVQVGFAIRSSRPAAGWRLNGHFGPVPPRDGISTAILAPSRRGMASQPSFWPRPATGWHLNRHLGLVPPRDGVSTVILAPSRHGMASQRPFWPRLATGRLAVPPKACHPSLPLGKSHPSDTHFRQKWRALLSLPALKRKRKHIHEYFSHHTLGQR